MGHDPKPRDPRRLHLVSTVSAGYDEAGLMQVTVTYRYDEWCCDGLHEVADAIRAIEEILEDAQERRARADADSLRAELGLD